MCNELEQRKKKKKTSSKVKDSQQEKDNQKEVTKRMPLAPDARRRMRVPSSVAKKASEWALRAMNQTK